MIGLSSEGYISTMAKVPRQIPIPKNEGRIPIVDQSRRAHYSLFEGASELNETMPSVFVPIFTPSRDSLCIDANIPQGLL